MSVPDWQALMLPSLRAMVDKKVWRNRDVYQRVAKDLSLTNSDLSEMLPSGLQSKFQNRVSWALFDMTQAGLLESVGRGQRRIAKRGIDLLQEGPTELTRNTLRRFKEYEAYISRSPGTSSDGPVEPVVEPSRAANKTPDELLQNAYELATAPVRVDLLRSILERPPEFFEKLVLKLLTSMGFGSRFKGSSTHLGQSGDGGLDGVIDEDALGLDQVYVQAKRNSPDNAVGSSKIRDFAGALGVKRARKGVFITTSRFSEDAVQDAERSDKRIVLINGEQLVDLLLKHGVGVRTVRAYEIKVVDLDEFDDE